MGLLKKGEILTWQELWKTREIIKNRGIDQFITVYQRNKDNKTEMKAYGEELELIIIIKTDEKYKLYCGGENIINKLDFTSVEYARYMVEISAVNPRLKLNGIEEDIINKINMIEQSVENISVLMMPCFPHLHFANFYDTKPLTDDVTLSLFFPDNAITQHKRFESFTQNIRNRRGRKPEGYIPIYQNNSSILIDSMGQGMGCCGLQVTLQLSTIQEARYVYDMTGVLGPLLLYLTRGTPCANGKLLETETRWEMLEMSVDCRTNEERGSQNSYSLNYENKIPKSRCSSFDLYISDYDRNLAEYNDTNPPVHEPIYSKLIQNGIDPVLARHVASLFIRDPIISYTETDPLTFDDFENIQSSNWRSVRFKIPTESSPISLQGWKVEVRPMEMQATAFENTAFIYFTYLLVQAIIKYDLNLYIPISKVDDNFTRANYNRNLFWYRSNITDNGKPVIKEDNINVIFSVLMQYVYKIIDEEYDHDLLPYIKFIEGKINGEYMSLSDWIRKFVTNHKLYKNDSNISEEILQDLISKLVEIRKENSIEYLRNQ